MNRFTLITFFLFLSAGLVLAQGELPTNGLVHQYTFDNANNLEEATVGENLTRAARTGYTQLFNAVAGYESGDGAVEVGLGSYYELALGLDPNGPDTATRVNQFSFVIDFYLPTDEVWYAFHASNNDGDPEDGDWDSFVRPSGVVGVGTSGYSYYACNHMEWYRLVISADLGVQYKYFLDGQLAQDGGAQPADDRFSLPSIDGANIVTFFGDNSEEDANIYISNLAVYDRALADDEIVELGGFGHFITADKPVAGWTFDDLGDLLAPSFGEPLVLVGDHTPTEGPDNNNNAVKLASGSYYEASHNILPNKGGTRTNEYTMVFDVKAPEAGQTYALYNTASDNGNDAELKINGEGKIGSDDLGWSDSTLIIGDYYKIVVSVSLGDFYKVYVDGDSVLGVTSGLDLDGRYSLESAPEAGKVLLFADDNGEDALIEVANVNIYNRLLSNDEILGLGGYDHGPPNNEPTGSGKAVYFKSTDQLTYGKVEKTNDDFNFGDGDFTIEVWTKPDFNFPSDPCLLSDKEWDSGGNAGWVISVRPGDNDWKFNAADESRNRYDVNGPKINDGNWHHLAVIAKQDSGVKLITDDLATVWADDGGDFFACGNIDNELPIGFANDGTEDYNPYFGEIDEVRIWKGVAIPQEVVWEWRSKKITDEHPYYANLVGYWRFDEGNGTTVADQSGKGHDVELIGGTKWNISYAAMGKPEIFAGTYKNDVEAVWGAVTEKTSGGMTISGEFPYPQDGVIVESNVEDGDYEIFAKEDNPYIVFAHNGKDQLTNNFVGSGVEVALGRSWYVDATETSLTNPVVKFDFADLGITGEPGEVANYVLLKRNGADFEVVTAADSKDGTVLTFVPAEVSGEAIYTLGSTNQAASGFNGLVVGVEDDVELPTEFNLANNYPNPFNPATTIQFAIPVEAQVELRIYNVLGQEVATLVNGTVEAGSHSVEWSATGKNIASGMYIYRLTAKGENGREFVNTKKMLLLK